MTSKGIAQRLTTKYGKRQARERVEDRLYDREVRWAVTPRQNVDRAAKYIANATLWSAVLHHVKQS